MTDLKVSFSGGAFDPRLWGRIDLDKYEIGAAFLRNFTVNFGGGARKRDGMEFIALLSKNEADSSDFRLFPLKRTESASGAFVVVMGPGYVRLVQGGGFVLRSKKTGTWTDGLLTPASGDSFIVGDLLFIPDVPEPLKVIAVDGSGDASLENLLGDTITQQNGALSYDKVLTLDNPYSVSEFPDIGYTQARGDLYFAHPNHPPHVLALRFDGRWTLTELERDKGAPLSESIYSITTTDTGKFIEYIQITNSGSGYDEAATVAITDPTGTGFVGIPVVQSGEITGIEIVDGGRNYIDPTVVIENTSGTGATFEPGLSDTEAGLVVSVSAIVEGEETGIMRPLVVKNIPDFTQTAGSVTYSWTEVPGASSYRVYRSFVFPNAEDAHIGYTLGLIGTTIGTKFTDANIQPDFTKTPIIYNDPFAPGALTAINAISGGSGYQDSDSLIANDLTSGTAFGLTTGFSIERVDNGETLYYAEGFGAGNGGGFVGYPIVQKGSIIGVYIANPGKNYNNPEITIVCNDTTPPPASGAEPIITNPADPVTRTAHLVITSVPSARLIPNSQDNYGVMYADGFYPFNISADNSICSVSATPIVFITEAKNRISGNFIAQTYSGDNDITSWTVDTFGSFAEQTVIVETPPQIFLTDCTAIRTAETSTARPNGELINFAEATNG